MRLPAFLVPMPKASVDLDNFAQSGEDKIGSSGKFLNVKPITKAHSMHEPADYHFWSRIFASDTAHIFTSRLLGYPIHLALHWRVPSFLEIASA